MKFSSLYVLLGVCAIGLAAPAPYVHQTILESLSDTEGDPLPLIIWHGLGDKYAFWTI